jgi:hypothetical protein
MPLCAIFTYKPPHFGRVERHYAFAVGKLWSEHSIDDCMVCVCQYGTCSLSREIANCRVVDRQYMLARDIPDDMIANSDAGSREQLIRKFRDNHDRTFTADSMVTVFTYTEEPHSQRLMMKL